MLVRAGAAHHQRRNVLPVPDDRRVLVGDLPWATRARSSAGTSPIGWATARSASEPIRLGTITGSNTPAVEPCAPDEPSTRPISVSASRSCSRSELGSESAPDRLLCDGLPGAVDLGGGRVDLRLAAGRR